MFRFTTLFLIHSFIQFFIPNNMKLKSIIIYGLIVLFTAIHFNAGAQSQAFIPMVFQKSPNSQAFEKYGNYPVNLYSGLPDITIPLYTIQAGSLQVPITISYHASGIKVNEPASYVGAGWSVNSGGGGITRNILGRCDDNGGYLSGFTDASGIDPTTHAGLLYLHDVATRPNQQLDTRPDIYSYDVPGHSGKFFFNAKDSYKVETIPFAPLAIAKSTSGGNMCFNMKDEHGTAYNFGYTTRETTTASPYSGTPITNITTWKLESMTAQNGRDVINFAYNSNPVLMTDKGEMITIEDQESHSFVGGPGETCPAGYANTNPVLSNTDVDSQVTEQDVSEITYRNGKVVFTLDGSARADLSSGKGLDNIQIYTWNFTLKDYELQKTIKFYKSYYSTYNGWQGRLRLDAIEILDKAGATIQRYSFDYNTQATAGYLSFSRDYWGYYNGKSNSVSTPTLIPQTVIPFEQPAGSTPTTKTIGSSDPTSRDPDSTYMQAGVLTTIHYPTGGYTNFKYQTNRYNDGLGVTHLTGGLRIDSIINYDNINATPIIKSYQYNTAVANFMTTGFNGMINQGFFVNTLTSKYYIISGNGSKSECVRKRIRSYLSEPALNLTPTEGNPVAYTDVTEYIGSPTVNTGKSTYKFRYTADNYSGTTGATGVPVVEDYFYARGQLIEKDDYQNKGAGTYQIVKKTTNNYTAFGTDTRYDGVGMVVGQSYASYGSTGEIVVYAGTSDSPNDVYSFPYANYNIVSNDNYLTGTITTLYDFADPTKSVSTSVAYNYGTDIVHQQILSTTHVDSKNNTRTTNNTYAFNYPAGNAVIDTMVNRHMWADEIEKSETYKIGSAAANTTSAQLNQFKYGTLGHSIVPDKVSILNIIAPVGDFTPSTVSAGAFTADTRYKQMISFDKYDAQNNIAQYTPRNSTPVSILWDYQYELPVAQVKNATYSSTTNAQTAYTSFEAPNNGGWSYSGATSIDPTAPTGNRVYNLSGGTVTSPSMDAAKSYVVSLWSKSTAPNVTAGSGLTSTAFRVNNGWTYYEYTVPAANTTVTVSGTQAIDELRIYPIDAQMSTYTYDPNGITAMADTKGSVNHFEYDAFSRLKNIKDWNGYIVKNFGYHTFDQVFGNTAISSTVFTRNNCPAGTTPGSTTLSLPANRFYAISAAAANAEATYSLPAKANSVCSCTP
jgi:hypothetical protein